MFWMEEDIRPATEVATKIFGQPNIYVQESPFKNMVIATGKFGKLWFGDIDLESIEELQNSINILSDTINQRVFVLNQSDHSMQNALFVSSNTLRKEDGM